MLRNRMRYPDEKFTWYFFFSFLAGFFAALLLVWCGRSYYLQKAGLISEFYLRRLKYKTWENRQLLGCFLGKRMKWAALFPAILFWQSTYPVMLLAGTWLGLAFGVMAGITVLKFGVWGPVVLLLLTMPQGLFYLTGCLLLLQGLADWQWNFTNWLAFPVRKFLAGTVLFFLGILTESFLNPWNLRLLFHFF